MAVLRCQKDCHQGARVIYRRGHSIRVMVYAGLDPLTGKKKWVSRQVPGTGRAALKEAKQIEAKLLAEVAAGRQLPALHRPEDQACPRRPGRQPARHGHPGPLLHRAAPPGQQVPALLPAHPQRPAADAARRGLSPGFTGKERVHQTDCVQGIPMTASAIRDVHAVLSGALQQAVVWGWRTDNPARLATPPAVEKAKVTPPEATQAVKLIETATTEDPELGLFLGVPALTLAEPSLDGTFLTPGQ
jgi:integrase